MYKKSSQPPLKIKGLLQGKRRNYILSKYTNVAVYPAYDLISLVGERTINAANGEEMRLLV